MVVGHLEYGCEQYFVYSIHNSLNSSREGKKLIFYIQLDMYGDKNGQTMPYDGSATLVKSVCLVSYTSHTLRFFMSTNGLACFLQ